MKAQTRYATTALILIAIFMVAASKKKPVVTPGKRTEDSTQHFMCTQVFQTYKQAPAKTKQYDYQITQSKSMKTFAATPSVQYSAQEYNGGASVLLHRWKDPNAAWGRNTLTVGFKELGGHEAEQQEVMDAVKIWEACCAVHFQFVNTCCTDIFISFEGGINESLIGRRVEKLNEVSMYLALRPQDSRAEHKRLILHEFGHAMGFLHEHQVNDGNPFVFDTLRVIDFYHQPPNKWEPQQTINNVIARYRDNEIRGTRYDSLSIMCYSFPGWLLKGRTKNTPDNYILSDSDKYYARQVYH